MNVKRQIKQGNKLPCDLDVSRNNCAAFQHGVRATERFSWRNYISRINRFTPLSFLWSHIRCPVPGLGLVFSIVTKFHRANALAEQCKTVSRSVNVQRVFRELKVSFETTFLPDISAEMLNCSFDIQFSYDELKGAMLKTNNSSPGADGLCYKMCKHMPASYRPISLPSNLCKSMVRLVTNLWNYFLGKYRLLSVRL